MKTKLITIKTESEKAGISTRRIQCRLIDAVKREGMITDDGYPTIEAQNLVREVMGQAPRNRMIGCWAAMC